MRRTSGTDPLKIAFLKPRSGGRNRHAAIASSGGVPVSTSILAAAVRAARPGAIETGPQEDYVRRCTARLL
jgi:hypothetical protein